MSRPPATRVTRLKIAPRPGGAMSRCTDRGPGRTLAAVTGVLTLLVAFLMTDPAAGQSAPVVLELTSGSSRPIRGFDRMGFSSGASGAAHVVVELGPRLAGYGGYRWTDFDCPESPCGPLEADGALQERGWVAGLQLDLPSRGGIAPRLRAGATLNRLVRAGQRAPAEIGVEVEGGVVVRIGRMVDLVPTLGYRRWDSDSPGAGSAAPGRIEVSHIQVGVGLTIRPWGSPSGEL